MRGIEVVLLDGVDNFSSLTISAKVLWLLLHEIKNFKPE